MKVFIAANLLKTGQMSGWNETTAYKMITQSDDVAADALYGRTGGDNVVGWAAQTYNIPFLGAPPPLPGWWGGTRITAHGLATFYNAIAHDPAVGPWLIDAMSRATPNGSDGTYQYFGIPSAATTWAVKQGWGEDSPNGQPVFNSTGMVGPGDRFAVAILTQGPGYGAPIADMVTDEAQILLPDGTVSPPAGGDPWAEFWQQVWDYLVNLGRTNHWFGL